MMGNIHKTDKLDAQGLATLLYLGKLPSVWIPPAEVRDERELPRTRMVFSQHRTRVKNRIRSTLAKYALSLDTASDIFAPKWRPELEAVLHKLPAETERCARQQLQILDALHNHIPQLDDRTAHRDQHPYTDRHQYPDPHADTPRHANADANTHRHTDHGGPHHHKTG